MDTFINIFQIPQYLFLIGFNIGIWWILAVFIYNKITDWMDR